LPSLSSVKSTQEVTDYEKSEARGQNSEGLTQRRKGAETAEGYQIAGKQAPTVSRLRDFAISRFSARFSAFPILLFALAALLLLPANGPNYNRFWHALMVPADDLAMRNVVETMDTSVVRIAKARFNTPILTTYGQGAVASATGVKNLSYAYRSTWTNGNAMTWWYDLPGAIMETGKNGAAALVLIPTTTALLSPCSITGRLSGHWLPQAAILECGAGPEIEMAAKKAGGRKIEGSHGMLYSFGDSLIGNPNGSH
jgi:hypothetical protein